MLTHCDWMDASEALDAATLYEDEPWRAALVLVEKLGRFGALEYANRTANAATDGDRAFWRRVVAVVEQTDRRQARRVLVAWLRRRLPERAP